MQLATVAATPPATAVPVLAPGAARLGTPTTQTVLATVEPQSSRFPGSGIGIGSWMVRQPSVHDAISGARELSIARGEVMGVLRYRPKGSSADRYAVAPLVALRWEQMGYGGTFHERALTRLDARVLHGIDKLSATLVAAYDGARCVGVTR